MSWFVEPLGHVISSLVGFKQLLTSKEHKLLNLHKLEVLTGMSSWQVCQSQLDYTHACQSHNFSGTQILTRLVNEPIVVTIGPKGLGLWTVSKKTTGKADTSPCPTPQLEAWEQGGRLSLSCSVSSLPQWAKMLSTAIDFWESCITCNTWRQGRLDAGRLDSSFQTQLLYLLCVNVATI